MRLLQDEDIKHYIKLGVIGILLFFILAISLLFLFRSNYRITLSQSTIEFGDEVHIVDLIQSIGDEKISQKNKLSSNTIQLDAFEVSFTEIDLSKLGEQQITAIFSDESIKPETFRIEIVDTTAPVIQLTTKEPVSMDLEIVKAGEFESVYKVHDNYTGKTKIKVKTYIEEDSYTYDEDVHLKIEATDSNGNTKNKTVMIHINPESEPDPQEEEKEEAKESQRNEQIQEKNSNSPSVTPGTNSSTVQTPSTTPATPKPSNRQFLFSQGYNMGNVESACNAALNSSGATGACVPLQDSNGYYIGMELRFY
ncbi:MAG: hypothetical protein SPH17_00450 [Faecalicoccus sp.]|uniref:hypothetical protein n=1 Tax=Faecalicoccus sp. TaxID=1971758 RepID=UPI002A91F542|nr:hypothetical protein [Faecalicoccus sp.]MDY5232065.1 hypothetical protein [Faecalicoccus sp.]